MNPLLKRFNSERKVFATLRKRSESQVVRWEYWNWPKWNWDPDDALELRRIAKRVPKERASNGYGYDKENRVIVIQQFRGNPPKLWWMEFLRYSGDKMMGSHFLAGAIYSENKVIGNDFQAGGVLANVFEATLSSGRIVRAERLMTDSWQWDWKTIEWEGDNVATVLEGKRGQKASRQKTYSRAGKLIEDLDLSKPVKPPKRQPLPEGVTVKSLAQEIRQKLVKAVVATVARARVKEPVYCLALNYDCEGNPLLPPELGIGLDAERQSRLKRGDPDAKFAIWEPEQFSIFANNRTELRDKDLSRACDLLNRELAYRDSSEPARKVILQAAADLAKMEWRGKLNPTDDFVVYAVDTDLADLRKNLKLTVPPKQLAKLKAAKLL